MLLLQSRSLSREGEGPAFFISPVQEHCWVEAKNSADVCQIYDANVPGDVEEMTRWLGASPAQARLLQTRGYIPGQSVEIVGKSSDPGAVEFVWMRAGKRIALGVLLHPDRMGILDWQDLSGIGPALANKIITDRQNNGDFGSISNIIRVSGIGDKTLESIRPLFVSTIRSRD
ncbi:MAG: helix-hairpin-helix domain-containing protein [Desulfuromonadaceae bacterium]